tara:strand:- start:3390 stop:3800 length:411 start_codon:yes stop_codon:yes gene_type:complete
MKNVKLFEEFLNENIRKQLPEFLEKIKDAEDSFPSKNKRSKLQQLSKKNPGSEVLDQDSKFVYSPDGEVFVAYDYADQEKVDSAIWDGKGDIDKAKEDLVIQPAPYGFYAETGRPGWRVFADGKKIKIGKYGETKY